MKVELTRRELWLLLRALDGPSGRNLEMAELYEKIKKVVER